MTNPDRGLFPRPLTLSSYTRKGILSPDYVYIQTVSELPTPLTDKPENSPGEEGWGKQSPPHLTCSCGAEAVDSTHHGIPVCAVHLLTETLDARDVTDTQPSSEVVAGMRLITEWNATEDPGWPGSPYCRCGRTANPDSFPPACHRHRRTH